MKTTPVNLTMAVCRVVMEADGALTKGEIEVLLAPFKVPTDNLSQVLYALRTAGALVNVDEGDGRRHCYGVGDIDELRQRAGEVPAEEAATPVTPVALPRTRKPRAAAKSKKARAATPAVRRKTRAPKPVTKANGPVAATPELADAKFDFGISEHGDLQIAPKAGGETALIQCDDVLRMVSFLGLAWPIILKARPELAHLGNAVLKGMPTEVRQLRSA